MRVILYFHLIAIVYSAMLTMADTGLIPLPGYVTAVLFLPGILLIFSWLVFPLAMAIAAFRLNGRSFEFRLLAVAGDVMLSLFQLWIMLPWVQ